MTTTDHVYVLFHRDDAGQSQPGALLAITRTREGCVREATDAHEDHDHMNERGDPPLVWRSDLAHYWQAGDYAGGCYVIGRVEVKP